MNDVRPSIDTAGWMAWARELQALAQTGLHFTRDNYDRARYVRIQELAAEIVAGHSSLTLPQLLRFNAAEFGYATPKVDVRGAVFREGRLLLVPELADAGRWTLPGGWADVNETPTESVAREVREESGLIVVARKLLAVFDREKQRHPPPFPYHVYKLLFRCDIVGGELAASEETGRGDFFAADRLPELSLGRVTPAEIACLFVHQADPHRPTDFD